MARSSVYLDEAPGDFLFLFLLRRRSCLIRLLYSFLDLRTMKKRLSKEQVPQVEHGFPGAPRGGWTLDLGLSPPRVPGFLLARAAADFPRAGHQCGICAARTGAMRAVRAPHGRVARARSRVRGVLGY